MEAVPASRGGAEVGGRSRELALMMMIELFSARSCGSLYDPGNHRNHNNLNDAGATVILLVSESQEQ